ncbi:hypothetical protein DIC66_18630 [Rhodoferax lacus]|uniref:DUF2844 domain-containing protein n=1 Tax=Rhodoferax lacus TaxID=2184758 RepID=A0A3E1R7N8_9BURK|nr:DUF2844 domain-containing protein [Rhodoferax lacus]RFO95379.1 hypothetical protein DIC66_18630 [Rhodoferax lacus]
MTSSSPARWLLLGLLAASPAWAGLGEAESSIDSARVRMRAQHSQVRAAQYTVHELKMADGSRVRQFVAGNGQVFAVNWTTLYKPDLFSLLGSSYGKYNDAVQAAAQRGGIQRQFRHDGADLVVQSSAHLNVYRGFAYRPSMLPAGMRFQTLGQG